MELVKKFPSGIKAFGSDALRFAFFRHNLSALDINFSLSEVDEGLKFCNKLWNMVKYGEIVYEKIIKKPEKYSNNLRRVAVSLYIFNLSFLRNCGF